MAVYKHVYQSYQGSYTRPGLRFLVLPRYAYQRVFQSKFLTAFFVACFAVPVGAALLIYLHHNVRALEMLRLPVSELLRIDEQFFFGFLAIQGVFSFLLTVFVGPGLVSPDLTNNALPLYLCRPFSKTDYVLGKMSVLVLLQSAVMWIPGLLLFLLQGGLEGDGWITAHLGIAWGVMAGSWIWILVLSLLALALSAWVKWRPVAGALLFGVFFVASGFGEAINGIFHTKWGHVVSLNECINIVWASLFFADVDAVRFHLGISSIPVWSAWASLLGASGVCLFLLARKVQAYEVVRS